METKRQIRERGLTKRDQMQEGLRRQYDKKICGNLKAFFEKERKRVLQRGIYGYYPHRSEVNLWEFYLWVLAGGLPLAFPRVSGGEMEFYQVASMEEFEKGAFGIYEPAAGCRQAEFHEAVCLVPGSVFDWTGNRYGYGKGYYDRYFLCHPNLYRVGIAYEMQVRDRILAEGHDVKMQALATETGVYQAEKEGTGRKYDGIIRNL